MNPQRSPVAAVLLLLSIVLLVGTNFSQTTNRTSAQKRPRILPIEARLSLEQRQRFLERGINAPWASPELAREKQLHPGQFNRSYGPAVPPLGQWKVLVLMVDFSDIPGRFPLTEFDRVFFWPEQGTFRDYMSAVSYGALTIIPGTPPSALGWIRAPATRAFYVNDSCGFREYPRNAQKLVGDVVELVDSKVDFSDYDNDHNGSVDAMFIVAAGCSSETYGGDSTKFHSHEWHTIQPISVDGVSVYYYALISEMEYHGDRNEMMPSVVGVIAHEGGHLMFGLPDLYDRDGPSLGLGTWSLMASGNWNPSWVGTSPAFPDAWSHCQMGYVKPVVMSSRRDAILSAIEKVPDVRLLWKGGVVGKEYFLIENRQLLSYDAALPGSGLLIYHVDESVVTQNDSYWYPGLPSQTVRDHYLVALEQADGKWDLEHGSMDGDVEGDAQDPFWSSDPFSGGTGSHFSMMGQPVPSAYDDSCTFVSVMGIGPPTPLLGVTLDVSVPPLISSFAPRSGIVGTSVTITGTDFAEPPSANLVRIGTVSAAVKGGTATTLQIEVPNVGLAQPITVTSDYSTAWSSLSFVQTFLRSVRFDSLAFSSPTKFETGAWPRDLLAGDLNGDGKPDLVVAHTNDRTLAIYRNTSTPGSVSFQREQDIDHSLSPIGPDLADINADGKLDLVVAGYADGVAAVYTNQTQGALIQFSSSRFSFNNQEPTSVVVRDLNADGRPEIAVANKGSISVHPNVSRWLPQLIGYRFGMNFPLSGGARTLAVGDVDGDGQPDFVTTNRSRDSLSVWRNTTYEGSFSVSFRHFAPSEFVTGGGAGGDLELSDLDGDGKLDAAITTVGKSVVVFRNTSSVGNVAFERTIVSTGGSPAYLAVGNVDGDNLPDLVVGNLDHQTISIFRNVSTPGSVAFAPKVDRVVGKTPAAIQIADCDGDGRNDMVVNLMGEDTFAVLLGVGITPPLVSAVSPLRSGYGEVVQITGTGFSSQASDNCVFFGGVRANVTSAVSSRLLAKVPAGAGCAPVTVMTSNGIAYAGLPFVPTSPVVGTIDSSAFGGRVRLTSGQRPRAVAVADLDGDGRPDLAVVDSAGNTVSVFLNASKVGNLGTASFPSRTTISTGAGPCAIALGDFDIDGKLDLAVAHRQGRSVSVFPNRCTPGNVAFASPTSVFLGAGVLPDPLLLEVNDVDKNGLPDIVVHCSGPASPLVQILLNVSVGGTVRFSDGFAVPLPSGAGFALGDMDGDGLPDFLTTSYSPSCLSVYRNTSKPENLSYAGKVDVPAKAGPRFLGLCDLDDDTRLDIVVGYTSAFASVFRNLSTPGAIQYAPRVDIPLSGSFSAIAMADCNGDQKCDLILSQSLDSVVTILQNTSIGSSISFAAPTRVRVTNPSDHLAVQDLDADGIPDLVLVQAAAGCISVLKGNVTVAIPQVTSLVPGAAPAGSVIRISGQHLGSTPSGSLVWFGATQAVVSSARDTALDVVVPRGATYGPVSVTVAKRTGFSRRAFVPTFTGLGALDSSSFVVAARLAPANGVRHIAVSDMDGDGKPDLLAANYGSKNVAIFRNVSTPGLFSFADPFVPSFSSSQYPQYVVACDLDGDGTQDVVVVDSYYYTQQLQMMRNRSLPGSLSFGVSSRIDAGPQPRNVTIADLNGDGRPDIAVGEFASSVKLFRNTTVADTLLVAGAVTLGSATTGILYTSSGDLNGDGRFDIVTSCGAQNAVWGFRNTCMYGFSSFASAVTCPGTIGGPVVIGDMDKDGDADVIVGSRNLLAVFPNNSTTDSLSFSPAVCCSLAKGSVALALGDITGDSLPDIVTASDTTRGIVLLVNASTVGSFAFGKSSEIRMRGKVTSVAIADFDQDGRPDLAVSESDSNRITIYRNAINITGVTPQDLLPTAYSLGQNYPNPFNPLTVITYQLPDPSGVEGPVANNVRLVVYDLLGRVVATLVNERQAAGSYSVKFDAAGIASGVYLYQLRADGYVQTRKMLLVR